MQFHGKVFNNRFYRFTLPAFDIACFCPWPSNMCHEDGACRRAQLCYRVPKACAYPVGVLYLAAFLQHYVVKPDKNNLTVKVCVLNQPQDLDPILLSILHLQTAKTFQYKGKLYDTMFYALCEDRDAAVSGMMTGREHFIP